MKRQIFVNIAVQDLPRSRAFYSSLGFSFNEQFSDDTAACLVISEEIYAMLLTHPKMQGFLPEGHRVNDSASSHEALLCLSCDSRQEVDRLVEQALASGGTAVLEPKDYGFMYYRAFQDPDGHIWEMMHMDETQLANETSQKTAAQHS
jgi:predicted lactoylglutathione lyase